jgi:hypothetical protein
MAPLQLGHALWVGVVLEVLRTGQIGGLESLGDAAIAVARDFLRSRLLEAELLALSEFLLFCLVKGLAVVLDLLLGGV